MSDAGVAAAVSGLLKEYDGIGWNLSRLVRPGLNTEQIFRAFSGTDLYPGTDVVELFEFINGVDFSLSKFLAHFFIHPNFYLMTLDECISVYRLSVEYDVSWERGLFPLFDDQGGLSIAVDLSGGLNDGRVFRHASGEGTSLYCQSISSLFELIVEAISKGIIFVERDDDIYYLEMDDEQFEEIRLRKL